MTKENDQKAIRICFVSPKSYPLFNPAVKAVFGGAEVDLYLLGTELAKDKNFNISFITADYGQSATDTIENVKLIKSLNFKQNPLFSAWRIWQALRKANADIYILKTASPGVPLVGYFCKRNNKIFIYRTAHQNECDGTYLKKHPLLGLLFINTLRKAKMVFAQNETDAENLKKTTNIESIVIPNGHRITELDNTKRDSILWVGRSAGFKRPDIFLKLARKFPNEKFIMICQKAVGDINYDSIRNLAHTIPNLDFYDRVGFNKIEGFFKRTKVFVNTSSSEGFANTFIQASVCAVPILSLKVNPDNFINKYSCGFCCNDDEGMLIEKLKFMLQDNRYIEHGVNARKYAEKNHDITKTAEQYKKILNDLLAKNK